MFGRKTRDFMADYTSEILTKEPARPKDPLAVVDTNVMNAEHIADYRKTCEEIGVDAADILVEEFRHFLATKDIPTFNLAEVCAYMDELVARDNPTKLGWHWCPVRPKDADAPMTFGRMSVVESQMTYRENGATHQEKSRKPASDFYESHTFRQMRDMRSHGMYREPIDFREHRSPAYTRTLPLHALKKIALIEREFTATNPVFLVTDYTLKAHQTNVAHVDLRPVNPDPFLMAVIPNSAVSHGKGRFIIDVWDEPGFGIAQMMK